jgi:hypothetical protein
MTELYEYPSDHVGTRHYVSVRGYARSIPKYKTFRGGDGYSRLRPEYGGDEMDCTSGGPFILPDKAPYISPMDGTEITSRSHHREHMRKHNVIECGDSTINDFRPPKGKPVTGQDIADVIRQLGGH